MGVCGWSVAWLSAVNSAYRESDQFAGLVRDDGPGTLDALTALALTGPIGAALLACALALAVYALWALGRFLFGRRRVESPRVAASTVDRWKQRGGR